MDAITIQILRNKVASLVDEMHYHFYRSGYSTIIRESRDFSCVILDREGRLIVAPPMFFHAPRSGRSEEHTSELQSLAYLVCRLLLEKKKKQIPPTACCTAERRCNTQLATRQREC